MNKVLQGLHHPLDAMLSCVRWYASTGAGHVNQINLISDDSGVRFDATALATLLESKKSTDQRNALIDLVELNKYAQGTLQAVGFDGLSKLRTWVDALPAASALRTELQSLGVFLPGEGLSLGSERGDVFLRNLDANSIDAGACRTHPHAANLAAFGWVSVMCRAGTELELTC